MKISIGHSPSCLLRLYKAIKEERKLDVTLDFAHSAYVEPVVLLPLTQLCIEGLKRGFKIG